VVVFTPVRRSARSRGALLLAIVASALLYASPSALAAPALKVDAFTNTTVAPGDTARYLLQVTNVGADTTDGSDLTLNVTLPSGLTGVQVTDNPPDGPSFGWVCPSIAGATSFTCTKSGVSLAANSFDSPTLIVEAAVAPTAAGSATATFSLSGGGSDVANTVAATTVTPTAPGFGVAAFDGQVTADPAGAPFTQAGGHPYAASTSIDFNTITNPDPLIGPLWPVEPTKDILVDLPPGFVGDPTGTDQCTTPELATSPALCPPSSQVGVSLVHINAFGTFNVLGPIPVYNMVPPPDVPARFAFNVEGVIVTLDAKLRSGSDYGLSVDVSNIPEGLAIAGTSLTFWGVPSDPSHDGQRSCANQISPWQGGPSCSTGVARRAFLRNPTSCTAPNVGLPTTLRADSWTHPGDFKDAAFTSHLPPAYPATVADRGPQQGPTGCDRVPFDPTLTAAPAAPAQAGKPAGFAFDLSLPQSDDPDAIGEADLRKAVVTLPAGVRVSPSSANGLQACTPAQIGLHADTDARCPDQAKLGSLTITTPLLDKPMTGSIYLAAPHDNPFDSLLAVYLVAKGPGLVVKLAGNVQADATTGQVTTTFDNNPQLPFSNLHLQFDSGARAPLVLPKTCGTYQTHSVLTSWSGKTVSSDSSFTISADSQGAPCPSGTQFSPGFTAGSENPVAGGDSAFVLGLTRSDLDQDLGGLSVDMPTGLLGRIAGTVLCSDADAGAGTCGDGSKIGGVTVGAGAGSDPFYINNGRAYITGPYKGAPFGLSIVVPAVAGPFDLGDVVVRATVNVDRSTAQLHVVSDPLPTILQGIPLDVRDVRVAVNRSHFVVNPTSCAEKHVLATVTSTEGARADVSSRFQVGDCAALPLAPKLAIALTGKGQTTDDKHPAVVASLTQPAGQANLKKVTVSLPLSLALDPDNANGLCEFADGSKDDPTCPKASIVGSATAKTPILDQPLTGPVYFVKNIRKDPKSGREIRTLPKLVIPLTGENGVRLNVTGTSSVVGGRLVTTFDNLPDAPVSSFTLNIAGGKHGILVVSGTDICKATQVADQQIDGQNGKTADAAITLATPACGLKVLSKKIGKRSITLKVGGLGAGRLTVTGKGIKTTHKTIIRSTVVTVSARRTKGRLGAVKIAFVGQGARKATVLHTSLVSRGAK
jgi:hypothetical protein